MTPVYFTSTIKCLLNYVAQSLSIRITIRIVATLSVNEEVKEVKIKNALIICAREAQKRGKIFILNFHSSCSRFRFLILIKSRYLLYF